MVDDPHPPAPDRTRHSSFKSLELHTIALWSSYSSCGDFFEQSVRMEPREDLETEKVPKSLQQRFISIVIKKLSPIIVGKEMS